MLCIRNRASQSGPVLVTCSFMFLITFFIYLNMLYSTYQKQQRIEEYKVHMNEMYENMKVLEKVANSTTVLLRKLQKVVSNHKAPHNNFVLKPR